MRVLKLSATNCMKNRISQRCPQLAVARIYKLCMWSSQINVSESLFKPPPDCMVPSYLSWLIKLLIEQLITTYIWWFQGNNFNMQHQIVM